MLVAGCWCAPTRKVGRRPGIRGVGWGVTYVHHRHDIGVLEGDVLAAPWISPPAEPTTAAYAAVRDLA